MKRWYRFRLRSLLLFIFVCAIVAFWFRPSPPPPDHWLQDAEGAPLGRSKLEFFRLDDDSDALPKKPYSVTYTDGQGGFTWRNPKKPTGLAIRVFQEDCGSAMIRLSKHDVEQEAARRTNRHFRLPLARPDTAPAERSACGTVVVDGQPVEGAEILCTSVRTPGEGLVNPIHPMHHVLTIPDGSFRLYLPNRPLAHENPLHPRAQQRGLLIPPNSRFDVYIRVPNDPTLFPTTQFVDNLKPNTIHLKRATQKYAFDFESPDGGGPAGGGPTGGLIADAAVRKYITVTYHAGRDPDGYNRQFALPSEFVAGGGFLIAGEYSASYRDSTGKTIHWQPLIVDDNSSTNLRFKLPAPVFFSGRVLDGVTGEPLAGAFVGGWSGAGRDNLALLTPAEWDDLQRQPTQLSLASKAVQPLMQLYSFQSIVRTDHDGQFQLIQKSEGEKFYGVMAFARDRLPFAMGVYGFRKQLKQGPRVETGDFLLFPAARLTVHPVVDATQHPSVRPRWQPAEGNQPAWFSKFKGVVNESEQRQFSTLDWLEPNISQPLLVPADLRFRMVFDCPYDDQWIAGNRPQVFQLSAGAEADFGELTFQPAAQVKVRVVGPDGAPVEGAPVRRLVEDGKERGWSIAHNSDKDGFTTHHVPSNANVKLAVIYYSQKPRKRFEVAVELKTEEYDPKKPPQIQLTKAQVETLIGVKPRSN